MADEGFPIFVAWLKDSSSVSLTLDSFPGGEAKMIGRLQSMYALQESIRNLRLSAEVSLYPILIILTECGGRVIAAFLAVTLLTASLFSNGTTVFLSTSL